MQHWRRLICLLGLLWSSTTPAAEALVQPPVVEITDKITWDSSKKFATDLEAAIKKKPKLIVIEINSGGGFTDPGFLISKAIEASKVPIYCIVDGEADSMMFFILQSCPNRFMTRRSRLMAHEPSVESVTGSPNRHRLQNLVDELTVLNENMVSHYARRLHLTFSEIRDRILDKDWWMNPETALEVGAVDRVIDSVDEGKSIATLYEIEAARHR
jgi:ATP-dependent protease ClpP protease subunit